MINTKFAAFKHSMIFILAIFKVRDPVRATMKHPMRSSINKGSVSTPPPREIKIYKKIVSRSELNNVFPYLLITDVLDEDYKAMQGMTTFG